MGETLGSAVLYIGVSGTIYGTKWYKCFLETLTNTQRKKIIVKEGVRTFKFGNGNKLNSLYKVTCDLVKNAGIRDPEFIKILQVLPNSCEVCIHYEKTEPRPIVGFTLESYLTTNIPMNIKEINDNKVLHLIDHATRYNVRLRIPSKEKSDIINAIFKHWIYPNQ